MGEDDGLTATKRISPLFIHALAWITSEEAFTSGWRVEKDMKGASSASSRDMDPHSAHMAWDLGKRFSPWRMKYWMPEAL